MEMTRLNGKIAVVTVARAGSEPKPHACDGRRRDRLTGTSATAQTARRRHRRARRSGGGRAAVAKLGGIDILVNNAGILRDAQS